MAKYGNNRKVWTKEEDDLIRSYFAAGNATAQEMGAVLGRTVASVRNRANVLGVIRYPLVSEAARAVHQQRVGVLTNTNGNGHTNGNGTSPQPVTMQTVMALPDRPKGVTAATLTLHASTLDEALEAIKTYAGARCTLYVSYDLPTPATLRLLHNGDK